MGPLRSGVNRRSLAAVLVIGTFVVASIAAQPALGGKKKTGVYKPPYKNGPQGGDEFNHVERDPKTGEMSILRFFPGISPVVGCEPEPSGGWSMFRVSHRVRKPVKAVAANFTGMLDPYAWLTVGARTAKGNWLGVKKLQGPFQGSGKVTAKLFRRPSRGDRIWIEFGLQLGDACPQVGGAQAEFSSVRALTRLPKKKG
jgi:hypothetical protein